VQALDLGALLDEPALLFHAVEGRQQLYSIGECIVGAEGVADARNGNSVLHKAG
jgi:hypothetical protein